MLKNTSLQSVKELFCRRKGLFIIGAGVSAKYFPDNKTVVNRTSDKIFSLNKSFMEPSRDGLHDNFFSQDKMKKWFDRYLSINERYNYHKYHVTDQMSPLFRQLSLFEWYSKPRIMIAPNNYAAFNLFRSSTIINYNLDGLAGDICAPRHRVFDPHGTINKYCATEEFAGLVEQSANFFYRRPLKTDHVMMQPEDDSMREVLGRMVPEDYQYIAIIGYSFGKNGDTFDDYISLKFLTDRFAKEKKQIFILDPYSDHLKWYFQEEAKNKHCYFIPIFWDIFADALIFMNNNPNDHRGMDYTYNQLLDKS